MIPTRPIRKHPRWFGYIGSSTTYLLRTGPCTRGRAGWPKAALLAPIYLKRRGGGGPCPPIGRHRYFHKLYALDIMLDLKGATKSQMERAMQGHVLANAELIGTYQKGDR